MKQRTVIAPDLTTWTCIQAYAALDGEEPDQLEDDSSDAEGHVPVVCTASGGASSLCLELDPDWAEAMPDAELLLAIASQQK